MLFFFFSSPTGRVSLVQITALRLEALQLADQGLYECRILLLDEPTDELQNGTWTELSITGELCGTALVCRCNMCVFVGCLLACQSKRWPLFSEQLPNLAKDSE